MPNPSDIAIMLNDEQLIRLVASWPKLTEEQRENNNDIADIANLNAKFVPALLKRAKAHGLIYDNGTINEFAEKYINGLVGSHLKKLK